MSTFHRTPNPRVSVVMPVFNGGRFLREAVESILNQTFRDFEFVIIDDGSTDATASILDSYVRRDSRVKVHRQKNRGIVESLNRGCCSARGEYIARMDADDISAPERLERQVAFLDAHPRVGIVGCGTYDNIDISGAVLYTTYLPEGDEAIQRTLVQSWCFLHPSIIFRRALLAKAGLYRKEFEGAEDHDLILRLLEHGQGHNLQEPLISYRLNPKGLSITYHQYMNDLGEVAMRLARQRRSGQPENFDSVVSQLEELRRRRKPPGGISGAKQAMRDSLYAANRYYGFGCRELCAGRFESARRCFLRSLRTNCLFVKSWIGISLSLMPFASRHFKYLFRSSMQQDNDTASPTQVTPLASGT